MGFRRDRSTNDGEKEGLGVTPSGEGATEVGLASRTGEDCRVDFGLGSFEFGEFCFVPNCCCLSSSLYVSAW